MSQHLTFGALWRTAAPPGCPTGLEPRQRRCRPAPRNESRNPVHGKPRPPLVLPAESRSRCVYQPRGPATLNGPAPILQQTLRLVLSTSRTRPFDPRLTVPPSPRPRRRRSAWHPPAACIRTPCSVSSALGVSRHTLCPRRTWLGGAPSRTHHLPARCPSARCVHRRRHLAAPRPSHVLNPRLCGSPRDAPT